MDAKSIQKLLQAKHEMEFRKKQILAATRQALGQESSDSSEKLFHSTSGKKQEYSAHQSRQEVSPDDAIDDTTLELRQEFALLNKICEFKEIVSSGDRKLSRKASRTAISVIKEAKKAKSESKTTKPSKKPMQAKSSTKNPRAERIEKICWNCKAKFHIYSNWAQPPTLCKACTKYVNEAYVPSGPDRSAPVGWVHIYSGGAPGLGKRS